MKRSAWVNIVAFLLLSNVSFGEKHLIDNTSLYQSPLVDTTVNDISKEDELIDEVVKSGEVPKKEKVEYFNQVTRYGFKSLFSNTTYNAELPYNSQINPNAEIFIQDYMRGHSKYLTRMKGWG